MSKNAGTEPTQNVVARDHRSGAKNGPSRRALLKAGGALLGGAAGAGAITGFPTIWAQDEDVGVLQYPSAAASAVVLTIMVTLVVTAILRSVDVRKEIAL